MRAKRKRTATSITAKQLSRLVRDAVRAAATPPSPTFAAIRQALGPAYLKRLENPEADNRLFTKYLLPALGRHTSETLRPAHVEALLAGLRGTLAPETRNKIRNAGRRLVRRAQFNSLWSAPNPFEAVRPERVPERAYQTLTAPEAAAMLLELEPRWRPMFALAVYLGPRKGELFALRPEDVDMKRRTVSFLRSHGRSTTKTGRVRPHIPIVDELAPYLEEALRRSAGGLVFPGPTGGRFRPDTKLSRVLRGALARAGIVIGWQHKCRRQGCGHGERAKDDALRRCPKCQMRLWPVALPRSLRFYDLRHSCATLLDDAGCHPRVVSAVLGHAHRSTTERYIHRNQAAIRRELSKMSLRTSKNDSSTKRETGIEPATPSLGSAGRRAQPETTRTRRGVSAYPLMTVREAAKLLRLNPGTVYRLAGAGKLRSVRAGNAVRIRHEDIDEFLASGASAR